MVKICGIDEAGRGCIAGSLFVCGVACDDESLSHIANLNDSKKLTRKKRDEIYEIAKNISHFVVKISSDEIDRNGISACMKGALLEIKTHLMAQEYIFDGNVAFGVSGIKCVIKGDSKIPQISLASIFAKYFKDKESDDLHKIYPQWGFDKHKGYGTKEHILAIKTHGFSIAHRKSFKIKELENGLF